MYWYVELAKILIHSHPLVVQAELHKKYNLLECARPMTDEDCDKYKLVYLGHGAREEISGKLSRYE